MGKDRPPNYSTSSRRSPERGEYRSMTRSPSPVTKPSRSSRKKYSRSSSSSSSSSTGEGRRKGKIRDGSPIVLHSSPERGNNIMRSKWLDSSPTFRPMTPPPPITKTESPAPPPTPTMEIQPIPSFQREDNYRTSNAPKGAFRDSFLETFNQPYGNNYFPGGSSPFIPPEGNTQHGFNMNNPHPPTEMGHGSMIAGPPTNLSSRGPAMSHMSRGPPPDVMSQMAVPNVPRVDTSNSNIGAPWDPLGNFPYGNIGMPPPNPGILPPVVVFNTPQVVPPSQPVPSSSQGEGSNSRAVEQELVHQKRTLAIQREEYFKKKIAFIRDLKSLKDKKRELQEDHSKGSDRLIKENSKLQDEIEHKLKSLDSVIEMLTHIIGDKDEIEQLLKEYSSRPVSPKKRKRSRSKSSSRSKADKKRTSPSKRSSSPSKTSSSAHVNVVHYDPEIHWCSVCNVFPRSASVYLAHLHSDGHKRAVKEKKEKENLEEEFAPWRTHEKRELSPPTFKNAPSRRVPIRGVPFLVPSTAWYCSVCKMWLGDLEIANRHLRGEKHAVNYSAYVTDNPHWELDWLRDRRRAFERNFEAKSLEEDVKEGKPSKKETKTKDVSELSVSDVANLEERLMALISAQSKEGTSKNKNHGSSRSDASYSSSSDEDRKGKKKKKKSKKKKKASESREKSFERDVDKKGKRRAQANESEGRKDKRINVRDGEKDGNPNRIDNRDRIMNSWRGRGRGRGRMQDRGRFDNRRLINRNPLWRPSAKDRLPFAEQKEKLATGRNVFGLAANECYGPEVPPKKSTD